jgi:hypothetical protein
MRMLGLVAMTAALVLLSLPRRTQADPPLAAEHTHTCEPVDVTMVLNSRFQVKCDTPWTNPVSGATAHFFAAGVTTPGVEQAASIALVAATSSKKVRVRFRTSSTDNPSGCDTGDCRRLLAISLTN